jgi:hypothetical protein
LNLPFSCQTISKAFCSSGSLLRTYVVSIASRYLSQVKAKLHGKKGEYTKQDNKNPAEKQHDKKLQHTVRKFETHQNHNIFSKTFS